MITASDFRERVTVQSESRTIDPAGGAVVVWVDVCTVWAHVKPVKGDETIVGDQVAASQAYVVTVRYRPDVTPANRLVWRAKTFNVRSATNRDGKRHYLTMECVDRGQQI